MRVRAASAHVTAMCCGVALLWAASPRALADDSTRAGASRDALPGLHRVGAAGPLERGLVLALETGFGYLGGVVAGDDKHQRGSIEIAASYRPVSWLAIAARFSGRYDRHTGSGEGAETDTGWVGDPRVAVRAAIFQSGKLALGAEGSLWMPGASAPSIKPGAATVDGRLLLSLAATPTVGLFAHGGFRFDRSARSAEDADLLSAADRMSLGVSDSHALLAGLGANLRRGRAELFVEGSLDYLIGEQAPGFRQSPMRAGGGVRYRVNDQFTLHLTAEASLADPIAPAMSEPLFPIESRFTAMAGVSFALLPKRQAEVVIETPPEPPPVAKSTGTAVVAVTAPGGAPLPDAEVVLTPRGGEPVTLRTDAEGVARFSDLPLGPAEVVVHMGDHEDRTEEIVVGADDEPRPVMLSLERTLPEGQLRGVVRAYNSKSLVARLTVSPLGTTVESDANGEFEIDLLPGEYEVSIEADGYIRQTRTVQIEQDGVVILNVDLRPKRRRRGR